MSKNMYIKRRYWVRPVCAILLITFINQDIAWAGSADSTGSAAQKIGVLVSDAVVTGPDISFPNKVASISEKFDSKTPGRIINIQDAHASLTAQRSIVSILDTLVRDYDLKMVALEGSSGYIDTSFLRTFPNDVVKKDAAMRLMEKGIMSAGEFFTATSDKEMACYGVESEPLYRENVRQFTEIYKMRESVQKDVRRLTADINRLQEKAYTPELIELEKNVFSDNGGIISFESRWDTALKLASGAGVEHENYRNLSCFAACSTLARSIDFEAANRERSELIDELSKRLSDADLRSTVLMSIDLKAGKISQGQYYVSLRSIASKAAVDFPSYRNLAMFTDYITRYESIDIVGVMEELKSFEDEIRDKLFENDDQRNLHALARRIDLISGMFELSLAKDDLTDMLGDPEKYNAKNTTEFLKHISSKYGVPIGDINLDNIFNGIPLAMEFYKTAAKRDGVILERTIARMEEEGKNVAALITGGYHSRGIAALLRERNTSYIVILPKFDPSASPRPYAAVLTNKRKGYEELLGSGNYLAIGMFFANMRQARSEAEVLALQDRLADLFKALIRDPRLEYDTETVIAEWSANYRRHFSGHDWPRDFHPIDPAGFERLLRSLATKSGANIGARSGLPPVKISKDLRGDRAKQADTDKAIKELIISGKIAEIFLIGSHLVAYRLGWINGYDPRNAYEPNAIFSEEIDINQLFTKDQQKHIRAWLSDRRHRIYAPGSKVGNRVHFRVILDSAVIDWGDDFKYSHICHASYKNGCIYIGEHMLSSIFSSRKDDVRQYLLDEHELVHLQNDNFNDDIDKKKLDAIKRRIERIMHQTPRKYREHLLRYSIPQSREDFIKNQTGQDGSGRVHWGYTSLSGRRDADKSGQPKYVISGIDPVIVSTGLFIEKPKLQEPALDADDIKMKIWAGRTTDTREWHDIKMEQVELVATKKKYGVFYRFAGILPAFFEGRFTFMYSLDGGREWKWANKGVGDDIVITRATHVSGRPQKIMLFGEDVSPAFSKVPHIISLYKGDIDLASDIGFDPTQDSPVLFSSKVTSIDGTGEGRVEVSYSAERQAIILTMQDTVSKDAGIGSPGRTREEMGWDRASIEIPLDKGVAKRVIHKTDLPMGMSRTGIAIFMTQSGLYADKRFRTMCQLIEQELVLRRLNNIEEINFAAKQELEDSKTMSVGTVHLLENFIRGDEAFKEKTDISDAIKEAEHIIRFGKSWSIKRRMLEQLRVLVNLGRYERDRYLGLAVYSNNKDRLQELSFIERVMRQDPSFISGMGVERSDIDNIQVQWHARGISKAIYYVTFNMRDLSSKTYAVTVLRRNYYKDDSGERPHEIDDSLEMWEKMSQNGLDCVPHIYSAKKVEDYRPKILEAPLPGLFVKQDGITIDNGAVDPSNLLYNDFLIVAREFIVGYDVPGYCAHGCVTKKERVLVQEAGIRAYFKMWKAGQRSATLSGAGILNPSPQNVVITPLGSGYRGVVVDMDRVDDDMSLSDFIGRLLDIRYEKEQILAAAKDIMSESEITFIKHCIESGPGTELYTFCTSGLSDPDSIEEIKADVLNKPSKELSPAAQAASRRNLYSAILHINAAIKRDTLLPPDIRSALESRVGRLFTSDELFNRIRYYSMEDAQRSSSDAVIAFTHENNIHLVDGFLNDKPIPGEKDSLSNSYCLARMILAYMLKETVSALGKADHPAAVDTYLEVLLGPRDRFQQIADKYALKSRIRFIMEKDVVSRNLITYQRARNANEAEDNVRNFIDTIYTIVYKRQKKTFDDDDDLRRHLESNFGLKKVIIAGGKGTRFSPSGLIVKPRFKPDNFNTNVKLVRRSAAFGALEDIVVVDPTTVYYVLKENSRISEELKRDMMLSVRLEISALIDRGEYDAQKGQDLIGAVCGIISEDLKYTSSQDGLYDLPMVLQKISGIHNLEAPHDYYMTDKIAYAIFRAILHDWTLIDENKKDELFGANCTIMIDSGEGHGTAYAQALKRMEDRHEVDEARYSMIVYADSPGWSLDKYENFVFIAYLKAVNIFPRPDVETELPKAILAAKNPKDGRADGRAIISVEGAGKGGRYGMVPVSIKEWGAMSKTEQDVARRMAESNDPNFFTNANILIYDIKWAASKNRVLLSDYRHDLGEAGASKHRPHEYWASDYLNIAALEYMENAKKDPDTPPLTRIVQVGNDAPDATKTLPRAIGYRDALQEMLIRKIKGYGVIVDDDVTISISTDSVSAEFDIDTIIQNIFMDNEILDEEVFGVAQKGQELDPIRLKGSIYLDSSVKIGRGAVLDGTKSNVVLESGCVVDRGVKVAGVIRKGTRITKSAPQAQRTFIPEMALSERGTIEAIRVSDADLKDTGLIIDKTTAVYLIKSDPSQDDKNTLSGIFGSTLRGKKTTDQIFLYGKIVIDENVSVENGTVIDGRGNDVILTGNSRVGQGVSLKGVKANNTVFMGNGRLDMYRYKQPSGSMEIKIVDSSFVHAQVEDGAAILNSTVIRSYVASGATIENSDVLNEVVTGEDHILERRAKEKMSTTSLLVSGISGDIGNYIPGTYRLGELTQADKDEIRAVRVKWARNMYGQYVKEPLLIERMSRETEDFINSGVTDSLTIQQIMQYVFAKIRLYRKIYGSNVPEMGKFNAELAKINDIALAVRSRMAPLIEDVRNADISDDKTARGLLRRISIMSARFNMIDLSIDPKVFDRERLNLSDGRDRELSFIDAATEKDLAIDGLDEFEKMVFGPKKGTFLFLTDNIGETEADAPLWLLLIRLGHNVVIAGKDDFSFGDIDVNGIGEIIKSSPILSACVQDGRIKVIKSGSANEGIFAHTLSSGMKDVLADPSLIAIISKGQANLFNLSARNSLRAPFVTMLLSKSISSKRVTGVAVRSTEHGKSFWPIIAVVPAGTHIMDPAPNKPGEFLGTLGRFGRLNPNAEPPVTSGDSKAHEVSSPHAFKALSKGSILGAGGGIDWVALFGGISLGLTAYVALDITRFSMYQAILLPVLATAAIIIAVTSAFRSYYVIKAVSLTHPEFTLWQAANHDIGHDKASLFRLEKITTRLPFIYKEIMWHEDFAYHLTGLLAFIPGVLLTKEFLERRRRLDVAEMLERDFNIIMKGVDEYRIRHARLAIETFKQFRKGRAGFEFIYDNIDNATVMRKTPDKERYFALLEAAKRIYDSLSEKEKDALLLAIILHDVGFTMTSKSFDHFILGEERAEEILGEYGIYDIGLIENVGGIIHDHGAITDFGINRFPEDFRKNSANYNKQLLIMTMVDAASKLNRNDPLKTDNLLSSQLIEELLSVCPKMSDMTDEEFLSMRLRWVGIPRSFGLSREGLELSADEEAHLNHLAGKNPDFRRIWSTNIKNNIFYLFMRILQNSDKERRVERQYKLMLALGYVADLYRKKIGRDLMLTLDITGKDTSDAVFDNILANIEPMLSRDIKDITEQAIERELANSSWTSVFGLQLVFDADHMLLRTSEDVTPPVGKPSFIVGIRKTTARAVEAAIRKGVSGLGKNISIRRFSGNAAFRDSGDNGIFLDLSNIDLMRMVVSKDTRKYVEAVFSEAENSRIRGLATRLIKGCGRNETEKALRYVMGSLEKPAPYTMTALAELKETLVSEIDRRKNEISHIYNNDIVPSDTHSHKTIAATTERVLVFDMFGAENMARASKRISNCVIYGDLFTDESSIRSYMSKAGYTEELLGRMLFVNKKENGSQMPYAKLVAKIMSEADFKGLNITRDHIGIRTTKGDQLIKQGEMTGAERYLEICTLEIDGAEIVAAMNSYQALLKMLDRLPEALPRGTMSLDSFGIPGVTYDGMGIFRYLPPSLPLGYDKEALLYKIRTELLNSAA